jgi:hypothetical protein
MNMTNFIDGDLVENFLELTPDVKEDILGRVNFEERVSLSDTVQLIEQFSKLH